MRPVGFEPTISAGERSKTYALDRVATGIGTHFTVVYKNVINFHVLRFTPHRLYLMSSAGL